MAFAPALVLTLIAQRAEFRNLAEGRTALAVALVEEDNGAISAAIDRCRTGLGDAAGEPEVQDEYLQVPARAQVLSADEAHRGMLPHYRRIESMRFWNIGVDPATLKTPLRAPASIIGCMVAVHRAKLAGFEQALPIAQEAADFLMWAQQQAGAGCYPFPGAKSTSEDRAMQVATHFLERVEAAGKLAQTVRNGWVFEDHGDGGLQFDNGECGIAMLELYEVTRHQPYLDSVLKAADWAITRHLCPNWNYNSFSVRLLAKAYEVTKQPKYRDAALKKALLGVIPGQLTKGARAGRWMDPHNARPAYHYIMMTALAQLAAVLPANHPDRPAVVTSLKLGLMARNAEIVARGAMNKDKATECLLLVHGWFGKDAAFLTETMTTEALDALLRLVSAQARNGQSPLGPREWGNVLAQLAAG